MQMTLAVPAAESVDLLLAAWSQAQPAEGAIDADAILEQALAAQLTLRLDDTQIPLWDERAAAQR